MTMLRRCAVIALLGVTASCASSAVPTTPTFVPANYSGPQSQLPGPAEQPLRPAKLKGAQAVHRALEGVVVVATDRDIEGTTWVINDVSPRKVYQIPTAPLAPTTILLPQQETLASAVSGSTQDFTIGTAVTGTRAAVTVMPNCAHPNSKRFDTLGTYEEDEDGRLRTPLQACITPVARATFLTSGGPYNFQFVVNDYTAVTLVEINHATPPPTNLTGATTAGRPPFPDATAQMLYVETISKQAAPWRPTQAYADPFKMVIRFRSPLPELPGLYAGQEGEQVVNYSTIETPTEVFLVTDRRVTEAELRIDEQVVRISAAPPQTGRETVWK